LCINTSGSQESIVALGTVVSVDLPEFAVIEVTGLKEASKGKCPALCYALEVASWGASEVADRFLVSYGRGRNRLLPSEGTNIFNTRRQGEAWHEEEGPEARAIQEYNLSALLIYGSVVEMYFHEINEVYVIPIMLSDTYIAVCASKKEYCA
jgi:hypothetical protein